MALKLARYQAGLWRTVTDTFVKAALKELADKLDALARDVDGGLVFVGAILIVLGDVAVPAGWEVVVELAGRVPLGTVVANKDAGTMGGSMSHTNPIPTQAGLATGDSTVPHTHAATDTGIFVDSTGSASTSVTQHNTIAVGGASGTAHHHIAADHNHSGATGSADHTPAHVKVLFCRRIRPESR